MSHNDIFFQAGFTLKTLAPFHPYLACAFVSSPLGKKGTDLSIYLKRLSYEYILTYHVIILHQGDVFFSKFKQIFIFNSLLLSTPLSLPHPCLIKMWSFKMTITVIGGSRIAPSPALVTKAARQRCIPCLSG